MAAPINLIAFQSGRLPPHRHIICHIWLDPKFRSLSTNAKLVFIHLFSTPQSTPFGLYHASIAGLAAEMGWPIERYEEAISEVVDKRLAILDEERLLIFVNMLMKYNRPHNPNILRSWAAKFNAYPDCDLKANAYNAIGNHVETMSKGFRDTFANGFTRPEKSPAFDASKSLTTEASPTATESVSNTPEQRGRKPSSTLGETILDTSRNGLPECPKARASADASTPLLASSKAEEARRPPSSNRGKRLPANFTMPPDWIADGETRRVANSLPPVNLNLEAEQFVNHFTSASGTRGVKINWHRTWLNWALRASPPRGRPAKGNGPDLPPEPPPSPADYHLPPAATFLGYVNTAEGRDVMFDVPGQGTTQMPEKP